MGTRYFLPGHSLQAQWLTESSFSTEQSLDNILMRGVDNMGSSS